jgi:hypothetical protein
VFCSSLRLTLIDCGYDDEMRLMASIVSKCESVGGFLSTLEEIGMCQIMFL